MIAHLTPAHVRAAAAQMAAFRARPVIAADPACTKPAGRGAASYWAACRARVPPHGPSTAGQARPVASYIE